MDIAPIRVGVRGVILHQQKVLLVKFDDESGVHYNYPGGGVQAGETIHEALLREIQEETDAEVNIVRLLAVYEYLNRKLKRMDDDLQKVELLFLCQLKVGSEPSLPIIPDPNEVSVDWIPLDELECHVIYPPIAGMLRERLDLIHGPDPFMGNCFDFLIFS